ncbi:AAA-like domain-containing protein [Fervidobacterium riparium]|jgi:hypothetical protein|uniref:ATP-binding protein n=1 Tax=Fervidobacterium pennivorans (strain DSM 9078 / Ven5) TaxID=771875 RepID=H9UDQ1_FERPD|nr:AAA-like domain-containing protein [Fervidobacterium pennivorans]AFG35644.1 hypothetical protein Ferpe_1580 [Fervidobacterium pennivorans DSM 9078]MDM7320933.1 AAA-like domain-containing protein [Fervidobacterium sp.]UXF00681.1 transcriptional regulator [Fervidobacterium riparium]
MRRFCTTGPVDKETCYYVERPVEMQKALEYIENYRYFTISAPRQTGKTTFLNDVRDKIKDKYLSIFLSFETYFTNNKNEFLKVFVDDIKRSIKWDYGKDVDIAVPENMEGIKGLFERLYEIEEKEIVLMIDEFELMNNSEVMNSFLHVIRGIYHRKKEVKLRSVILISVGYLSGVLSDNASPFNIAEHLWLPYFTKEQVYDLLSQHENETGQMFDEQVKELIWHNAAGQPGLTNALAYDLVENKAKNEKIITKQHFDKTLYDFLKVYINRNMENIVAKAKKEQEIMLRILFDPNKVEFDISDERIKFLYLHGVIDNCEGVCCVKVPLYYKKLYSYFKPKINGERDYMITLKDTIKTYITQDGGIDLNKLLERYIRYIEQRGGIMFNGRNYYEGVYQYNLDQFLSTYVEIIGGKVYPEAQICGGRVDLLVNVNNKEYLIEVKSNIWYDEYEKGKRQLLEYIKRRGLNEGWYVIFEKEIEESKYEKEEIEGRVLHIWWIKTGYEKPSRM